MKKGTRDAKTATQSRRHFLALAATSTLAGAGSVTGAQAQSQVTTIRLGGKIPGWVGRAPAQIQDKTNPTLELQAGRQYRITWENVDGAQHNIALLDADRNVIQQTPGMSNEGTTQTIEFTATKEMTEYVCQFHKASMRGDIQFTNDSEALNESGSGGSDSNFFPRGATIRTETIVDSGLTAPLGFEVPPGERDRFFIVDQVGQIYTYNANGSSRELFLDIGDQLINFGNLPEIKTIDERGLLGLAFHPDFEENRKFYVHYSAPPRSRTPENFTHTQVLSEFWASEDGSTALPETERALLEIPSPYYTHNGGAITFGPDDGYLYMAMGDGGGSLQAPGKATDWYEANLGGNGQDVTENLLGSILRIDVDSRDDGKPYAIPNDNPLVGKPGLDEQYAWGFRNPWRISFSNGTLIAADVGQRRYEEVNVVHKGRNYGWNVREGGACFTAIKGPDPFRSSCPTRTPSDVRGGESLIDPVIQYPHTYEAEGVGVAVIGGYIYENATIPSLQDKYIFGDYSKNGKPRGSLFAATPIEGNSWSVEELTIENSENGELNAYLLCVGRDSRGELFALTTDNLGVEGNTGAVHRIRPPESEQTATPVTATPERPPTATATPEPTPTTTAIPIRAANETPTDRSTSTETNGTAHTGERGGIVSGSGPGLGVLAGLAGLAGIVARLLAGREEQ